MSEHNHEVGDERWYSDCPACRLKMHMYRYKFREQVESWDAHVWVVKIILIGAAVIGLGRLLWG